jgi:hypothetical protein
MRKAVVILIIGVFILGIALGLLINKIVITGNVVKSSGNYSWTTAICNSDGKCIDVHIACVDGVVNDIEPISDLVWTGNWSDYRNLSSYCK